MIPKVLIYLITWYKLYRIRHVPACRFLPTCTDYAVGALRKYSLGYALYRIVYRLVRCVPGRHTHFVCDEP